MRVPLYCTLCVELVTVMDDMLNIKNTKNNSEQRWKDGLSAYMTAYYKHILRYYCDLNICSLHFISFHLTLVIQ